MNIGSAIRHQRRRQGLTLQELCDAIGNDMQTGYLSRVETNKLNPSVYTVADIARALGTTVDALLNSNNHLLEETNVQACRKIAIYPFSKGATHFRTTHVPPLGKIRFLPSPIKVPPNAYGLILEDDSMQSSEGLSFSQGGIIIVSPYEQNPAINLTEAKVGHYVIVMSGHSSQGFSPLFRELISDGSELLLRPRNSRYPIRPLPPEPIFVGRVLGQFLDVSE